MNYGKKGVKAKQKALNSKSTKWAKKIALTIVMLMIIGIVGIGICGISAGLGVFKGILSSTPEVPLESVVASGQATIVYDSVGNEIDQYVGSNSNRIEVTWDEVPKHLGDAFVAIEDERFYEHNGIDFKGMVRAGYQFVKTRGKSAQGASTITQQLLKNTVFTEWTSEGHNMIKKIKRKVQEQFLALEISKNFTKEEVLIRYMNAINLGQNTLGIEAASQRYFGKSCSELTVSESAVIACITQNPTKYNPISHPTENARRRKDCLEKMLKLEFITQAQYDAAIADTDAVYERIGLYDTDFKVSTATNGSYFSDALYEQVLDDLVNIGGYSRSNAEHMMSSGGLRIEATLDPEIQRIADEEFANEANYPSHVKWYLNYALTIYDNDDEDHNFSKENMMSWFKSNVNKNFNLIFSSQEAAYEAVDQYRLAMFDTLGIIETDDNYEEAISLTPQPQAAIAIEDQTTGYVVAIVGGRGVKEGRRTLNRATSARRSPGSTFKVLASFAPALDSAGLTLASVYLDAPFNYDGGTPVKNWYKTGYRGICNIREAIRESMNIIAVKNQTVITPQLGYDYLEQLGFSTLTDGVEINGKIYSDVNQTIALGGLTYGVTPYELNAAYAAIANMGEYMTPKLYTRVLNSKGEVLLDNTNPEGRRVFKETTSFLITSAMNSVVTTGTGARVNFGGMSIAGKTGTSTDTKDVWFAGFTPYYTCSVWAGYDNSIGMDSDEGNVSKTLWRAVMKRVHEELPNESFPVPEGIVQMTVCSQSGKLPVPGLCDGTLITEYFESGTEPTESCDIHYLGELCSYDGLIASPECPFKYSGVAHLPLVEDASLLSGSTVISENDDGTSQVLSAPTATNYCQHNAEFFLDSNYEAILAAQQAELQQRADAAAATAPPAE